MCVTKKLNEYPVLMETPLIGGFVENPHEIISPAWSGKTTEGLVGSSDCHKTAKIVLPNLGSTTDEFRQLNPP